VRFVPTPLSPLLANIALHGLEKFITGFRHKYRGNPCKGNAEGKVKYSTASTIRYADDFVIIHESKEFVEYLQQQTEKWLTGVGLELKPSKTHICHSSEGFDFLGFNVRHYSVGAYRAATHNGHNLGFTTLITPSKQNVKIHLDEIGRVIDANRNAPQSALIKELNSKIKGWCNSGGVTTPPKPGAGEELTDLW
jgi:RNA-directed DNA polymerase